MQAEAERHFDIRSSISGFVVQEEHTFWERARQGFSRLSAEVKGYSAHFAAFVSQFRPSHLPRLKLPQAEIVGHLQNMAQHMPLPRLDAQPLFERLQAGWETALRFYDRILRLIRLITALLGWVLGPVLRLIGQLRLLNALVQHCWNDDHCLPLPLMAGKRWWLKFLFSLPVGVVLAGIVVYCAVPVIETRALAVPPITIRAAIAEPDAGLTETNPVQPAMLEVSPVIEEAPMPEPEAPWVPVNRAFPSFNLQNPDSEGMDFVYSVSSRGRYARRESMAWFPGSKHPEGARGGRIQLTLERFEERVPPLPAFLADMTERLSLHQMSIEKIAPTDSLATKFGNMDVADGVLTTQYGPAACLLFRHHNPVGFTIAGWFCGSPRKPVDRVTFTCFLDRLDLLQAGQDYPLRQLFAAAERNRIQSLHSCGSLRQPGRKMTWLDYEAPLPGLKLSPKDTERSRK
jgi:hypothetical protein